VGGFSGAVAPVIGGLIFFSASFGGMPLSIVLWEQGIWGWSALKSGLAIAPGPIVVPFMAFVAAGRMIARYGPARVIVLGAAAFGAGVAWWALAVEVHLNYVSGLLGGMLLAGIGVGLALPTMMSTASSSLPPSSFATGSAVINMIRQTGFALGIAVLVAVLGTRAVHPRRTRASCVPRRLVGNGRNLLRRDRACARPPAAAAPARTTA